MNKTGIEYLDYSWNPLAMHCTPVSEGCAHCWHLAMTKRLAGNTAISAGARAAYAGAAPPALMEDRLAEPMSLKKGSRIGVQFMGDLFGEDVPSGYVQRVFEQIARTPRHTYLILTKRSHRMKMFFVNNTDVSGYLHLWNGHKVKLPFLNTYLGVTVENAEQLWRIDHLLATPAAVRFVSCEPLLGAIRFRGKWINPYPERHYDTPRRNPYTGKAQFIDKPRPSVSWIICGAETGPGARPMDLDWARDLRDQCVAAGVPFFFKRGSDGNRTLDGRLWEQWPGEEE